MVRQFLGQQSTQPLHWMHCILWITHLPPALSTSIAFVGQALAHIPHPIQSSALMPTAPLVLSCHSLGLTGYISVDGFLNILPRMVLLNLKNPMRYGTAKQIRAATTIINTITNLLTALTYLSVQLMHGSIVRINIGTSARSQPCNILTSAGMFILVGVLTRILSRNLLPAPLA